MTSKNGFRLLICYAILIAINGCDIAGTDEGVDNVNADREAAKSIFEFVEPLPPSESDASTLSITEDNYSLSLGNSISAISNTPEMINLGLSNINSYGEYSSASGSGSSGRLITQGAFSVSVIINGVQTTDILVDCSTLDVGFILPEESFKSPGSRVGASLGDCNSENEWVLNGDIHLEVTDYNVSQGNSFESRQSGKLSFGELKFKKDKREVQISGSTNITEVVQDSFMSEQNMEGNYLAFSVNDVSLNLYLFNLILTKNPDLLTYSIDGGGIVEYPRIEKTAIFSIVEQLIGYDGQRPHSGEMLLIGKNSSASVRLLGPDDLRIRIDSDGDEIFESDLVTSWDQLELLSF